MEEVEVVPADYETIKKERIDLEVEKRKLQERIKKLKSDHEKAFDEKEATLIAKVEKEYESKVRQIDSMSDRIEELGTQMKSMDDQVWCVNGIQRSYQKSEA